MAQLLASFARTDLDELWSRVDAAAARTLALLGEVDADLRAAGSTWTARDVAGHLVTVLRRYVARDIARSGGLSSTPRGVDELNEAELRALGDVPRDRLLQDLEDALAAVRRAFGPGRREASQRLPFHGGATIDVAGGVGNVIGELLVHGHDVALAAGRPWPLAPRDAVLVLNAVLQVLPAYAVRGATPPLHLELRVPGAAPWALVFAGGSLDSRPARPGDRPDAVVAVPAPVLLLLLYRRRSAVRAVPAGLRVVGGRRPWRAALLPRLLEQP